MMMVNHRASLMVGLVWRADHSRVPPAVHVRVAPMTVPRRSVEPGWRIARRTRTAGSYREASDIPAWWAHPSAASVRRRQRREAPGIDSCLSVCPGMAPSDKLGHAVVARRARSMPHTRLLSRPRRPLHIM